MNRFLRNLNLNLLIAAFLAIVLWLFVTGDDITRTTTVRKIVQGVPLSYENLDPGLAVVKMPQTVDMTLDGLPGAFDELEESELEAYLDLTAVKAGTRQVQVRGKVPRDLILVSLAPQQVEVSIEKLKTRRLAVEVQFQGQPAAGRIKQKHSCHPEQLELEAVTSLLNKVSRVVVYVDLSDKKEPFQVEVTPLLLDDSGKELGGVVVSPPRVTVKVDLGEKEAAEKEDSSN
ncbi:MAG TPA: hypothetical protein GX744_05120 [Firmicutes bacterium]|nr:hypothetical protein [Bacillota bacterium]